MQSTAICVKHKSLDRKCGRRGHSTVIYKDCLYIFGGVRFINFSDYYFNDIHKYNINLQRWEPVQVIFNNKNSFKGREAHSAVVYNDKMWIWG